jgi:glycosyltransferase involved in cell wall biosynthesis
MTTDIFIRTYEKDLEWLKYCLRSIHKYVTGYRQIIICIPENQKKLIDSWNLTAEKVVTCRIYNDDYLGQQISKMLSFQYTDADRILFMDSDCVFLRNVDILEMTVEGKPIIYKTKYGNLEGAEAWKGVTEKFLGGIVEYEYMRRHPFMYNRETLIAINNFKRVEDYVLSQSFRNFSEFNVIGAFAEKYESDKYHFIDTESVVMPEIFLRQYWSWSGLTENERIELDKI